MYFLNYVKQNKVLYFSTQVKQNANKAMYLLNHGTHKTIDAFCFTEYKHSALSAMCYLSRVKHCKTSAMFYLNYVKPNTISVLCFLTHVKQNENNAM